MPNQYKLEDNKIVMQLEVSLDKVLYHLVHRSEMTEKEVKELFINDEAFQKKYMKICMNLAKNQIENELDEFDPVIELAEKTSPSKTVKKPKLK
jgi:chaperonin cofactor prefoldin